MTAPSTITIVKRYKGEKAYEQGLEEMSSQGWAVLHVADQGRPAIGAFLWGALVKRTYLVTFTRSADASTGSTP